MDKKQLLEYIDGLRDQLVDISDRIWEYAEMAFQEHRSVDLHCSTLEAAGFTVEKGVGGLATAFTARYGSGKPVIGLLAEYDALAGLNQKGCSATKEPTSPEDAGKPGHGCGHNLFGTCATGAALAVAEYLKNNPQCSGTVVVYGCPGEEGGSGKAFMAREGVFDECDAALNFHPSSFNSIASGSCLANIQVMYRFYGVASHAANAPENGRSALDAVELMNVGTQFLREHMADADRVHYAITNTGGFSPNVVQARADVLYLIRSPKSANAAQLYERVTNIAKGAALMTDTRVDVDFVKACSERVRNDVLGRALYNNMESIPLPEYTPEEYEFAREMQKSMEKPKDPMADAVRRCGEKFRPQLTELLAEDRGINDFLLPYYENDVVSKGSSDVGDVSWVCPTGGFVAVTTARATPGHSWQYVSCNKSSIAHKGLMYAVKVMAATTVDLMESPETVEKAKAEHTMRLGGGTYKCPIPKGVMPRSLSEL